MFKESILCILIHNLDTKDMKKYYVYWFRLPSHSNPFCDGYIGVTSDIERRKKEHYRKAKQKVNTHFYNALNKYDNTICDVLHTCDSEQAVLEMEYWYRPETNVGWNSAVGGKDTLKSVREQEVTLYHKDNPKVLHTFKSQTEASKKLSISRARISQAIYRKSPHYGFDGWAVLIYKAIDTTKTITIQEAVSIRVLGSKLSKPSHFKGMTNRWSKEDKQRISAQHKGKTISAKQIEITRIKNQTSHPSCKQVTLVHKDTPDVEHVFHSLSEASRQLGIPLSRIKSKAQRPLGKYGKDGWKITQLGSE